MTGRRIGQGLAIVLAIGGVLHGAGSFHAYRWGDPALAWSAGSAVYALVLAALCLHVETAGAAAGLKRILLGGLAGWLLTVAGFGLAIGDVADPRVLYHLVTTAGLIVRLALRRAPG